MSSVWSAPTRRSLLAASAFGGAMGSGLFASAAYAETAAGSGAGEIRPFHARFPDEALADLRRRVAATRWPPRETVADATQGVQLATVQALARHWTTEYDWRRCE